MVNSHRVNSHPIKFPPCEFPSGKFYPGKFPLGELPPGDLPPRQLELGNFLPFKKINKNYELTEMISICNCKKVLLLETESF